MPKLTGFVLALAVFTAGFAFGQDPKPQPAPVLKDAELTPEDQKAREVLLERLIALIVAKDASSSKRANACTMLGKFGEHGKAGVPAVLAFIDSQLAEQAGMQRYYYYNDRRNTMQVMYPTGTNDRLIQAVEALGSIGSDAKTALPVLIKLSGTVVLEAMKRPGEADKGNVPADPKPAKLLRATAAVALGRVGGEEALAALTKLLNIEKSSDTRLGAVDGMIVLAKSTDKTVNLPAQAQLRVIAEVDEDKAVRYAAAEALGPKK